MKKFSKWLSAAAVTLLAVIMSAVTAFAADDFCIFEGEGVSNGSWGQAVAYNLHEHENDPISITDFTEDSKIYVTFEVDGTPPVNTYGIEFILQRWEAEGIKSVWARVQPVDVTDGVATFDYASMTAAYGSDDFSDVDQLYVGDSGVVIKVTNVSFDLSGDGLTDFATEGETAETEEEKSTDEDKAEETTAKPADKDKAEETSEKNEEESSSGGVSVVLIVVIAVVVIAAVVVVLVLKNRKRYY